jgi:c-di-GMP-binding flagellar brake protein YcgR
VAGLAWRLYTQSTAATMGSTMSTLDDEDRREYYRISDHIALQITPLSESEAAGGEVSQDPSQLFNLLSELHLSEFESQHLVRQLGDSDRTLGNFLRAQNKRIDLLSQVVAHTLLGEIGETQAVVLSEGGLECQVPQSYAVGSLLAIKMVLMPQALGLQLRARVTRADALGIGHYEVGLEFDSMTDAQRQLIARYILQKQAAERRLAREQSDASEL